jgi:hypothetical protein
LFLVGAGIKSLYLIGEKDTLIPDEARLVFLSSWYHYLYSYLCTDFQIKRVGREWFAEDVVCWMVLFALAWLQSWFFVAL